MDRRNFLRTASSFALLAAGATTGVSRVFAKTPSFSLTGNQSDENTPNMGDTMEYRKLGVTRNFAASLFRNIKYFTLRKLYLCRKWMQKRLQKTTTTGITLPNFDFLA